jgi:hypothetical protein
MENLIPYPDVQALRFYGSFNVLVSGITIVNSSQCHLKFDNCQGVMVHDITISSPENSVNTDGIHLQNSKDVSIHHANMACGNIYNDQTFCFPNLRNTMKYSARTLDKSYVDPIFKLST